MINLKVYNRIVLLILLFFSSFSSFSQVDKSKNGLQLVEDIFKKMYSESKPTNKTTYVNYLVTTKARKQVISGKLATTISDIKYYSNNSTVWFFTDELKMYRDDKYTFSVIPKRNAVYWGETPHDTKSKDVFQEVRKLHDSIFKNCKNVICEDIQNVGDADKLVKIELEKKWMDLFQIKSISFYINSKQQTIYKQLIEYTDKKNVEYVEYLFKDVIYNYTKVNLNQSIKNIFLDKNLKLKSPYDKYQLIDVRKK